jgi:DNA invertase Pin-like site-specific DNA recombinase
MIAVYARQSIDKKDSDSIETQIAKCVNTIDNPIESVNYKVYRDKGYSGSNIDRPDFKRLMQDIEAGVITKVIVYKVDRFSRSLIDFYNVYKLLEKRNVEFCSLNDNFDTGTATGRAMLSITLVFAQLERETIALRVKDNYYARAKQGRTLGGKTHFGYTKVHDSADNRAFRLSVPDAGESGHLYELFQWYDDGFSLGEICDKLKEQNVSAPMGGQWESAKVSKILRNPFYVKADVDVYTYYLTKGCHITNGVSGFIGEKGCLLYGKRDRNAGKYKDLNGQYLSLGLHNGLVDADKWLRVQVKLDANVQVRNSGKGQHTWLSGLTKCGLCGYAMTYLAYKEGRNYLNCRGKTNYHVCQGQSAPVLVEDIEELAEDRLLEKMASLAHLAAQAPPQFDGQTNALKMQLVEIEREYDDYMAQLRHADDYLREHIANRLMMLEEKQKKLSEELRKRRLKTGIMDGGPIDADALLVAWRDGNLEERKKISKKFISQINIKDDNEVEICWRVPE